MFKRHFNPRLRPRLILALVALIALLLGASQWTDAAAQTSYDRLTLTRGEINLNVGVIDTANGFAYYGTGASPGGGSAQIIKVRLSDFTRVGAITLNTGENSLTSAVIDPANGFAYFGTLTSPGIVVKVNLNTFTRDSALTLNTGENQLSSAVIDPANHFAYFVHSSVNVVKVDLTTFTRNSTLSLAGSSTINAAVIDPAAGFAYFGTTSAPARVIKVNLASFTLANIISFNTGEDALISGAIDPAHGFAYFGLNSSPNSRVVKVNLATFARVGAVPLNTGESNPRVLLIDSANNSGYLGLNTTPGAVIKFDLATFTRVGALNLILGENNLFSAVGDPANGFAYFGTSTSPGIVVKVRLSDFTRVDGLILNPGENTLSTGVIDTANGFAYFGTTTSPGIVVKVRLSDFTRVGAITLNTGENNLTSAVIDSANGFAYFGTNTSPGRVVKVRLSDFTRDSALTLNTGEDILRAAVIDSANGFAYFGTGTSPGIVVKVRLSDFTRDSALTLNTGENTLRSVVIDPVGFAYFGTNTSPGRVVKVNLASFVRVNALTFNTGENNLTAAAIDPTRGVAYFGTTTGPGRVVAVNLETFARNSALTLSTGENNITSGVMDTANCYAYFGLQAIPGVVIRKPCITLPPTPTPTDTPTNTPVPPTDTPTDTPTNTPIPTDTPTATFTPTDTPTNTAVPPTNTPTNTPVPPTDTPTNTATNTPVPPTDTPTNTPVPPTNTPTNTPVPPTNTPTSTPTNTAVPPTNTPTFTSAPPTATPTFTPAPPTPTPTQIACSQADFLAAVRAGDVANGTINLNGNCIYTLTSANNTFSGGTGAYIFNATTLDGHGAIVQRDPTAPQFRLLGEQSPNLTIRNVTLRNGNVAGSGGGLFAFNDLTLVNVRFENNKATNGSGGAVWAQGSNNLTVDRSFFLGNSASNQGGVIFFWGSTANIKNSVFANNASGGAGAVMVANKATGNLTILSNTVTDAFKNPKEALSLNGSATIQNNIFHNFKSGLTATGGTAVSVSEDYNLFAANDVDPQGFNSTVITRGGHSRIAAAPRFVDPTTFNYHLQANSSAIDLGVAAGLATDADGLVRPFAGTGVDIGAYEYQGIGIPSVSIAKSGPPYIGSDGNARFALIVINESNNTLNDLRIVEQLPTGATYVTNSASDGGSFASGALTWNLAPLAPNQSKRVEYKVTTAQTLVSNGYSVSSVGNPALTATGATLTTPYDPAYTAAWGFFPYPDGYNFPNWGGLPVVDSDLTADDMALTYGAANVCKVQSPSCVLTTAAESWRQAKIAPGGHCFGLALQSLSIFDLPDVAPSNFQPGANLTFDLTQANARRSIERAYLTQMQMPISTAGLPTTAAWGKATSGIVASVNLLRTNLTNPAANDHYVIAFYKTDWTGGHAVTPYAVRQIDANTTWIYVYDNNYPNNFDRVFKVTTTPTTTTWIYEGGATAPGQPVSTYNGDETAANRDKFQLRSARYNERFPKICSSSTGGPCDPAVTQVVAADAQATLPTYDFELDGEGYIMITRSDGLRAGFNPTTGAFIGEIPGSEQVFNTTGLGFNIPNIIRIPHTAGMTYSVRVADRPTEYGNTKAVANLNIYGGTFIARLKGIKLDSAADPAVQPGNNDVVGITFDADNKRLVFQSSTLDSDTPSLSMAVSQANPLPDYTFEVGGAQMPAGKALAVAFNQATGQLVISNNDPANNTYSLNVERLNQDGSKTTYQSNAVSDGTGVGVNVDLSPSWTGGAPPITQNNGPTTVNDSYVTSANAALIVAAPGVLANDTAPYGSKLTASLVAGPAHGTLTFNANGSFAYTPVTSYSGADSFTYKVSDGVITSNIATVSLTVRAKVTSQLQQVSFNAVSATTTPDATYPAQSVKGVVVLRLIAKNNGAPVRNVSFLVQQLTNNNYLLNADGGPGQVGSKLTVPNTALPGGNQLWDANENLTQDFRIGMMQTKSFSFKVDVYASKPTAEAAAVGQTDITETQDLVGSFEIEVDPEAPLPPSYTLYLPVVNK